MSKLQWHRIKKPSEPITCDRNRREASTSVLRLRVWPNYPYKHNRAEYWAWEVDMLAGLSVYRRWKEPRLENWGRRRTMREAKAAAIAAGHTIIMNLRNELRPPPANRREKPCPGNQ